MTFQSIWPKVSAALALVVVVVGLWAYAQHQRAKRFELVAAQAQELARHNAAAALKIAADHKRALAESDAVARRTEARLRADLKRMEELNNAPDAHLPAPDLIRRALGVFDDATAR